MAKKLLVILVILGTVAFLFNCKTTPEEPEKPVVEEKPVEKPEEKPEEPVVEAPAEEPVEEPT